MPEKPFTHRAGALVSEILHRQKLAEMKETKLKKAEEQALKNAKQRLDWRKSKNN
jgi:hypothetical protein